MVLFLGVEPSAENERDGMVQRIRWVDEQFEDTDRIILQIRLWRNVKRERYVRSDHLRVEKLNAFVYFPRIVSLVMKSKLVYVHSCYNSLRGLPVYFLRTPVITDLHGVVPEEMDSAGHRLWSWVLSRVEKLAAARSSGLVFVTTQMRKHFVEKYPSAARVQSYVIPILSTGACQGGQKRDPRLVIYSGGLQLWQNTSRMLEAVEKTRHLFDYVFLTKEKEDMIARLAMREIAGVEVASVPRAEVFQYYERATYGFILRDDSVVNRVACPTKLVEYLCCGVIPIVLQPRIGDFEDAGYRFVLLDDFEMNRLPGPEELDEMRVQNRRVVERMKQRGMAELARLKEDCSAGA